MIYRIRAMLCVCLVLCSLAAVGQVRKARGAADLLFRLRPTGPVFDTGSDITLEFSLKNISQHKVLATREASLHDLIYLEVRDGQGKRIGWQGKIVSRSYPADFFVVLEPGQSTSFRAVISSPNGSGYQIKKAGTYRVQAEFSLAPKEYFAPVSQGAVIPDRPVKSNWTKFVVRAEKSGKGGLSRPIPDPGGLFPQWWHRRVTLDYATQIFGPKCSKKAEEVAGCPILSAAKGGSEIIPIYAA